MDKVILELKQVACTFFVRKSRLRLRRVDALKNINLQIFQGETLGIVGQNGGGKSTMLQLMSRILSPTSGHIERSKNLSIALLTLQQGFSPELTGRENAMLGAMYLGFTKKQAQAKLENILEFAELGAWIDEPLRTYSTGMAARLGFSVAMEMQPQLMLIDEVMGVGDAYFQNKSAQALYQKMQSGQSTVLVSHDAQTMQSLCSRVIWIHNGLIQEMGDPEAVIQSYLDWVQSLHAETAGAA